MKYRITYSWLATTYEVIEAQNEEQAQEHADRNITLSVLKRSDLPMLRESRGADIEEIA